ncbi:hypothetical protein SETIT_1G168400v2 [Setaria italica]|uniref:Uncharacterized protein n=1 Tax=Setaria italica TaxID=4555 RepID=A0A368PM51_SETIT|nr:hypothetical protein SETIT_1G168400v2 [Setaria italica]
MVSSTVSRYRHSLRCLSYCKSCSHLCQPRAHAVPHSCSCSPGTRTPMCSRRLLCHPLQPHRHCAPLQTCRQLLACASRITRNAARGAQLGSRNSERLAAKDKGMFVDATTKASQLKALQNSLALCSKPVQLHVSMKKLPKMTKKPIAAADLMKLSEAVSLEEFTAKALGKILALGGVAARKLDQVLEGHP